MLKKLIITLMLSLATVTSVQASCTYNGGVYTEGASIGPYQCQGGKWVRR